jgi:hypothetical protein
MNFSLFSLAKVVDQHGLVALTYFDSFFTIGGWLLFSYSSVVCRQIFVVRRSSILVRK